MIANFVARAALTKTRALRRHDRSRHEL